MLDTTTHMHPSNSSSEVGWLSIPNKTAIANIEPAELHLAISIPNIPRLSVMASTENAQFTVLKLVYSLCFVVTIQALPAVSHAQHRVGWSIVEAE